LGFFSQNLQHDFNTAIIFILYMYVASCQYPTQNKLHYMYFNKIFLLSQQKPSVWIFDDCVVHDIHVPEVSLWRRGTPPHDRGRSVNTGA